jgi:hypothetical protein
MIASPTMEFSMSATQRPRTAAEALIGSDRKRSVTPLAASVVMAIIVVSKSKSMVVANMPGIRNSK